MTDTHAFAFIALAFFLAGMWFEQTGASWMRRRWRAKQGRWQAKRGFRAPPKNSQGHLVIIENAREAPRDAADQLRVVMQAEFEQKALLSKDEAHVLYKVEDAIKNAKPNWRVMAQVCLGEILRTPDRAAYGCINSKRCDLLIISSKGLPIAAIEYQGRGHYQGSAAARDAIKKEALRKAGVRTIEVTPEDDLTELKREIFRLAELERPKTLEPEFGSRV